MTSVQASFWEHIDDLRTLLIRILAIITITFVFTFLFRAHVITLLTYPAQQLSCRTCEGSALLKQPMVAERVSNPTRTPQPLRMDGKTVWIEPGEHIDLLKPHATNHGLVIFGPMEGFSTVLTVCFWSAVVFSSPVWLALIGIYIAPVIGERGGRLVLPFAILSTLFMFAGAAFAMLLTIPMANRFFEAFNDGLGTNLWSLNQYLNYTVFILLASALAFEVAALMFFLVYLGKIDTNSLRRWRKGAILVAMISAAILTPPDVVSQLMLAIPLIVAYELAIVYASSLKH